VFRRLVTDAPMLMLCDFRLLLAARYRLDPALCIKPFEPPLERHNSVVTADGEPP
jgi:hypothetical protein